MRVYLDNAATTAVDAEVLDAMLPYFKEDYGNASSLHTFGRDAAAAVDEARASIAGNLNAAPNEIYFTSGGTESDNWAIRGAATTYAKQGRHIVTTAIEHPAVIETCRALEKEGFEVTYLGVGRDGRLDAEELKRAVKEDTILVSVMFANNELGSIQPIEEIGSFCRGEGILFHTDAVQAAGTVKIDVKKLNIDMLSLSAHKFHGPKGAGALYIRNGVRAGKFITGGHQERSYRAGTTNTPGVVGMAKALEISVRDMEKNNASMRELRDYFIDRVEREIPYSKLNGGREHRLVNNVNFSFDFIEGESILMNLDLAGIAVSSGSACTSGSLEPSHVILAVGATMEEAHSSIRFSLGKDTVREEIDYTLKVLKDTVEKLRSWSPLFKRTEGGGTYV